MFIFFNDTATTEIYSLSLHDALPISLRGRPALRCRREELFRPEGTAGRGCGERLRRGVLLRLRPSDLRLPGPLGALSQGGGLRRPDHALVDDVPPSAGALDRCDADPRTLRLREALVRPRSAARYLLGEAPTAGAARCVRRSLPAREPPDLERALPREPAAHDRAPRRRGRLRSRVLPASYLQI